MNQARSELIIAKLFWKSTFKNKAVTMLILLMTILFIYGAFTGASNYKKQNEIRETYQEQAHEDWVGNPDKHPHRMAHYGHFAFRPKPSLSIFDFGMESYLGSTIFLEAHTQNSTNFSEAEFSTGMLRFGEISMAMVLQVLLPLLIFFLGFGILSEERENGTLKLIMTQGITAKQLVMGKTLGLSLVMLTLYLPLLMVALLIWLWFTNLVIDGDEVFRMFVIAVSYLFYLLIFCSITVIVSAKSKTSKTALTFLMGLWLLLIILLPRGAQSLGAYLYETPSKARFNADIESDVVKTGDSHNPDDPHYQALKDSVLLAYRVGSVEELPFDYGGFRMFQGEKITSKIHKEHLYRLRSIYEKQNGFSRILAFINPFLGIKNLSMALAGTDNSSYVDFQDQAEEYRYHMAQKMNELQMEFMVNKSTTGNEKPLKIDRSHWSTIGEFEYKGPGTSSIVKSEVISLVSLVFWTGVMYILLIITSKKLNVL